MNGFELITKKEEAFGVFEQTIEYKNHTKAKAFSMEETVVLLIVKIICFRFLLLLFSE